MLIVNYIVPHFQCDILLHKKITTYFIYPTLQVTSLSQTLFQPKHFIVAATKTSNINYGSHQIWYHLRMPIEFYVCPNFHFDIPLKMKFILFFRYLHTAVSIFRKKTQTLYFEWPKLKRGALLHIITDIFLQCWLNFI